ILRDRRVFNYNHFGVEPALRTCRCKRDSELCETIKPTDGNNERDAGTGRGTTSPGAVIEGDGPLSQHVRHQARCSPREQAGDGKAGRVLPLAPSPSGQRVVRKAFATVAQIKPTPARPLCQARESKYQFDPPTLMKPTPELATQRYRVQQCCPGKKSHANFSIKLQFLVRHLATT
ncbi:MAG: hypothetical protein ACT4NL_11640, partial [Pseudomarimonas sp.]